MTALLFNIEPTLELVTSDLEKVLLINECALHVYEYGK